MPIAFVTHRALPQLSEDDRLALPELRLHGLTVESPVWDSPLVDWSRYDALVIRSTWDYTERAGEFEEWLAHIERLGVPLWNPPPLVRWNMDKRYLADLAERGVSTVSTMIVERGSEVTLSDVVAQTGWKDLVYKPSISASGARTARVSASVMCEHESRFDALVAERDMLVQPFLPEIAADGEWSLVFLGGRFSHAVRKRAQAGEFRVQRDFGGRVDAEVPRGALIAQAESIMSQVPGPWLYARADSCELAGRRTPLGA